jgi:two-component system KDP operon response regulator KdpE
MRQVRILIVDDDPAILKFLRANLKAGSYETLAAVDGAEALQVFERESPDLVLLDITMPKMDGFDVCRRLREWSKIPIIMLSARGDEMDKVKCLDLGADDYLTKPFGVDELLARVRAVLRRTEPARTQPTKSCFTCEGIDINFADRRVTVSGREVALTPTEYKLLQELVLNANKVLTHSMLLGKVWGPEYGSEKEYLRVFISRLRKELEPDPINPRYLLTIPGVGYQFKAPTAAKS